VLCHCIQTLGSERSLPQHIKLCANLQARQEAQAAARAEQEKKQEEARQQREAAAAQQKKEQEEREAARAKADAEAKVPDCAVWYVLRADAGASPG
jgi:colicin import membrane protein